MSSWGRLTEECMGSFLHDVASRKCPDKHAASMRALLTTSRPGSPEAHRAVQRPLQLLLDCLAGAAHDGVDLLQPGGGTQRWLKDVPACWGSSNWARAGTRQSRCCLLLGVHTRCPASAVPTLTCTTRQGSSPRRYGRPATRAEQKASRRRSASAAPAVARQLPLRRRLSRPRRKSTLRANLGWMRAE